MKNLIKLKIIMPAVILLTLGIVIIGYLTLSGFSKNNIINSGKKELETSTILKDYKDTDYVICNNDLTNPEVVYFGEKKDIPNTFFIIYSKYSRGDIFSKNWDIVNNGGGSFYNTNRDKVKLILSSKPCQDLQKSQTIDGVQITYNPPLTPEQIQAAQKQQEQNQKADEQVKAFNALDPQSKIDAKKKDIEKGNQILKLLEEGKTIYPDGTPLEILSVKSIPEKERISTVKALLEQIKNEVIELEKQPK
jgi:hypothetical protein